MDPNLEDEEENKGTFTTVVKDGKLISTHTSGGQMLTPNKLEKLFALAKKRAKEINVILSKSLDEYMDTYMLFYAQRIMIKELYCIWIYFLAYKAVITSL